MMYVLLYGRNKRSRTRAKISILGTDFVEAMQEEIDLSQIPPEYGGGSGRAIDDSDDERKVSSVVAGPLYFGQR